LQNIWEPKIGHLHHFLSIFVDNNNNVPNFIANVVLNNSQLRWNLIKMGSNLGYWEYYMVLCVSTNKLWWWMTNPKLQDVKGHLIQHNQQVKSIDCKGHKVSSCDPCGSSTCLCDLQVVL
jgi:hypothetical protein